MLRPRFHPFYRLLFFALGSVALYYAVNFVIELALRFSLRVTPGMAPPDPNTPGVALFFSSLFYPPLLLWIWFCRHVFDRRDYVSLGLGIARAGRNFAAGAALGALALALVFCVMLLCSGARINGFAPEAFNASASYIAAMLLLYGALYFAVGYFEEVFFRGYLLQNFSALLGKSGGIALQAALFAAIHLMNPVETTPANKLFAMLNIALVGWLLALFYRKSGSLWHPIGFHVAWNFFLGCVFSLPVSGNASFRLLDVSLSNNALLTGGEFGPEGGILPVILLLALIWQARRLPDHARANSELDALQRGEILHLSPAECAQLTEISPPEIVEETREYSPPRYKTTLSAAPQRRANIDWSDVNSHGGAATTATFSPATAGAATSETSDFRNESAAQALNTTPIAAEESREYSPTAFTPNTAPLGNEGAEVSPARAMQNREETFVSTSRSANLGEAPLPPGARVTQSRSNFGAAPSTKAATETPRVLAEENPVTSNADVKISNEETPNLAVRDTEKIADVQPNAPPLRTMSAPPLPKSASISERNENRDTEIVPAPRDIPAPPPLPSAPISLPAAPPLPARAATQIPSDETPARILPPPPLFADAASSRNASTRAPAESDETANALAKTSAPSDEKSTVETQRISAPSDAATASTRAATPDANSEETAKKTAPRW